MYALSDNYYHRKCYFKRKQVPTQTVMKDRMCTSLALVYFKDMSPKLKVLAGLEPPMKGGGLDWYQPPDELLKGRAVLQPVKKEYLTKLGTNIINIYGDVLMLNHQLRLLAEKRQALADSDAKWKNIIDRSCRKQWEDTSAEESQSNTKKILMAFMEFQMIYTTATTRIDNLLKDAAKSEMQRVLDLAYEQMSENFRNLLKKQATMLYDRYAARLANEKAKMKAAFILNVQELRTELGSQMHDINLEKHMAIEKVRHLLECQNLACQVYVALKERGICEKELDLSKHYHKKKVRYLTEELHTQDFEIRLQQEQELKRQEFIKIWKKKICHVIKKFQIFVEFCLKVMPQHAEFFNNMEKLMLMQLNEAAENPSAESLFEQEEEYQPPVARPHPYYLCCDRGYKPQIEQDLCPQHCTSSASHMPVIIVNKRCIYGACDNFAQFTDKITHYIHGDHGDDADVADDHDYTHDIPVKHTMSTKLEELRLESSLMQILQEELPNSRKVRTECCVCKIPYCFCSDLPIPAPKVEEKPVEQPVIDYGDPGNRLKRTGELTAVREPKWGSYMDYVMPKKCKCAKTAKKHLREHIPAYMRNMSKYDVPDLPHYEPCPLPVLKKLVKRARKVKTPPPTLPPEEPKTKEVCTQYDDEEFDKLCHCFSQEEVIKLFDAIMKDSQIYEKTPKIKCEVVRTVPGSSDDVEKANEMLTKTTESFATARAYSLRNLLADEPDLEEIFKQPDCKEYDQKSQ